MDDVYICTNIQCAVYVYGSSSAGCPECGLEGKRMTVKQADAFTRTYREVQDGKIDSEEPKTARGGIPWGEDLQRDCKEMQKLENWGIFPRGYHYNNCSLH